MGRTLRSATWLPGSMLGEHERLQDDFSLGCVFTPLHTDAAIGCLCRAVRRYFPQATGAASGLLVAAWRQIFAGAYGGGGCTRCANCERNPVCHDPAWCGHHLISHVSVLALIHLRLVRSSPPPPPATKPIGLVLDADGFTSECSNGRLGLRLASASLTVNRCCGQRTGWRAPRR